MESYQTGDYDVDAAERACAIEYTKISKLNDKLAKVSALNLAETKLKARYADIQSTDRLDVMHFVPPGDVESGQARVTLTIDSGMARVSLAAEVQSGGLRADLSQEQVRTIGLAQESISVSAPGFNVTFPAKWTALALKVLEAACPYNEPDDR